MEQGWGGVEARTVEAEVALGFLCFGIMDISS